MIKQRLDFIVRKYCKDVHIIPDNFEGIDFIEDLELDSVFLMELLVEIEEEFHINFDVSKGGIEIFSDYDKMLEYLTQLLN